MKRSFVLPAALALAGFLFVLPQCSRADWQYVSYDVDPFTPSGIHSSWGTCTAPDGSGSDRPGQMTAHSDSGGVGYTVQVQEIASATGHVHFAWSGGGTPSSSFTVYVTLYAEVSVSPGANMADPDQQSPSYSEADVTFNGDTASAGVGDGTPASSTDHNPADSNGSRQYKASVITVNPSYTTHSEPLSLYVYTDSGNPNTGSNGANSADATCGLYLDMGNPSTMTEWPNWP